MTQSASTPVAGLLRRSATKNIRVTVPATTANLGSGFDCLGMALSLFNEVEVCAGDKFSIEAEGEGASFLSRGRDNLVARAVDAVLTRCGNDVQGYRLRLNTRIPLARGLGSSAAAVTAGLLAGNALCGNSLKTDELIDIATSIEGHPDNVAPAFLGGCVVAVEDVGKVVHAEIPLPVDLISVLFIPDLPVSTSMARAVLPPQVARADAVFNIGRAALLVASLCSGRLENLGVATQDRLHQEARQRVFPTMPRLFDAALKAGALGVFLSGAGSTVLAMVKNGGESVAVAMREAARNAELPGRTMIIAPCLHGALVEEVEVEPQPGRTKR